MSAPELTPWFAGTVKPARIGVYQRTMGPGSNVRYSRWNGASWRFTSDSPISAEQETQCSMWQRLEWRGLAKEPA